LVGAVGALRTFTRDDGKIELKKQRFHLDWVIQQGITEGNGCIMVAAGGSEGYFMSEAEWQAQVSMAAETADGRVPIIAGVFELSAREAVTKARFAAEVGCDFVQIAPPHYMVPTDAEVVEHFRWINDSVDIGIFAYNTPWAQPQPGYDFTESVLEQFVTMEHVVGVKWSSFSQEHYLRMARMFAPRLNFICNQVQRVLSMPIKLGFKGFVNSDGLVAPRFVLHLWELWQSKNYEAFDDLILKTYVDPFLRVARPEDITWRSMGEGPYVRLGMEALGMRMGPAFPAQQSLSEDSVRQRVEGFRNSGLLDWVDWSEELWEQCKAGI
jgi:4-hydroxy-tetrahydrodipicolinate synthase